MCWDIIRQTMCLDGAQPKAKALSILTVYCKFRRTQYVMTFVHIPRRWSTNHNVLRDRVTYVCKSLLQSTRNPPYTVLKIHLDALLDLARRPWAPILMFSDQSMALKMSRSGTPPPLKLNSTLGSLNPASVFAIRPSASYSKALSYLASAIRAGWLVRRSQACIIRLRLCFIFSVLSFFFLLTNRQTDRQTETAPKNSQRSHSTRPHLLETRSSTLKLGAVGLLVPERPHLEASKHPIDRIAIVSISAVPVPVPPSICNRVFSALRGTSRRRPHWPNPPTTHSLYLFTLKCLE